MSHSDSSSKKIIPFGSGKITKPSNALAKRGLELIPVLDERTIRVPQDYPTVEEAIEHANDGDMIEISGGEYFVSATIEKSLTIVGKGKQEVTLLPKENSKHIFRTTEQARTVKINNIFFLGYPGNTLQRAILCYSQSLYLTGCSFVNFFSNSQNIDDYSSAAIVMRLFIFPQTIVIEGCIIENCELGIAAKGKNSRVNIANCYIRSTALQFYEGVRISSSNSYYYGGYISLQKESDFDSTFDTYTEMRALINISRSCVAKFYHCTILVKALLEFIIGLEPINKDNSNWYWGGPQLVFDNCIVISEDGSSAKLRNASSDKNIKKRDIYLDVVDDNHVQFSDYNHLIIPPKYNDPDPQLNMGKNEIRLAKNSPARNQASDGTNLGAWQDGGS